jgi:hypothetical protein
MKTWPNWKSIPLAALAAATLLSGCSKQKFQKENFSTSAIAGQYVYLKPKLDIVVFQDASDSMANAVGVIQPQLNGFLGSLDPNWDYHFVVMPLLSQQTMNQKTVIATDCSTISGVANCMNPSQIGFFNSMAGNASWISTQNSGVGNTDYGFANMNYNINNVISSGGFFRSDALKAFVVVSNGEDQTNVAYLTRPDGSVTGLDYNSPTTINSFNAYYSYFNSLKTSISLNKFYSVVATNGGDVGCWGAGRIFVGNRYINMANQLGGAAFDLCSSGLSSVLHNIQTSLKTVVQTVEFNYVVISSTDEPDPNTIVLQKNGVTIPQDANNGWTYIGFQSNHPTTDYPTVGDNQTGYMVRLNGAAKFKGSDTISIDFQKK